MASFLAKRWFLIALTLLMTTGLWAGFQTPGNAKSVASLINPLLNTSIVLFLMSFSLETRQLQHALRTPFPVLLGTLLNAGLAPLLALACMGLLTVPDFRYGLLATASVPCTMAAASVWTRKANGNDAISLLVTLITNIGSIAVIPAWLTIGTLWFPLSSSTHPTSLDLTGLVFDIEQTTFELLVGVLLPIGLGQVVRQPARVNTWASLHKSSISNVAQILLLALIFSAALKGGARIAETRLTISAGTIALAWIGTIFIHLTTLYSGLFLSRLFKLPRQDHIAVAFAGSQKTLPVGILVSEALSRQAGLSFAVFPMLMYHASQLFLDTMIADRFVRQETETSNRACHTPASSSSTTDHASPPATS